MGSSPFGGTNWGEIRGEEEEEEEGGVGEVGLERERKMGFCGEKIGVCLGMKSWRLWLW